MRKGGATDKRSTISNFSFKPFSFCEDVLETPTVQRGKHKGQIVVAFRNGKRVSDGDGDGRRAALLPAASCAGVRHGGDGDGRRRLPVAAALEVFHGCVRLEGSLSPDR